MAGRRRPEGKPLVRTTRIERRTESVNNKLAGARNARDRIAIAADHLRSALAVQPDDSLAEGLVADMLAAADSLYRRSAKGGAR